MPKVSIIISTYQSAKFIREAIDSVLNQTYKDYEIIIVDDGSADGTQDALASYDDQIIYIRQEHRGPSSARNTGILASRGEYIAFLDADDLWVPNKLEVQVKFLDNHPNVYLIYSNASHFAEKDIPVRDLRLKNQSFFQMTTPHRGKVFKALFIKNFIGMSTVMVRKTCFEKVGLFDESLMINEDYDLWLRLAKFFEVDYQDAVLVKSRVHVSSLSRTCDLEQLLLSHIKVKQKAIAENPLLLRDFNLMTLNKCYYRFNIWLGMLYLFRGYKKRAKEKFKRYIQSYPYSPSAYFLLFVTFLPSRLVRTLAKLLKLLSS